MYATVIYWLWGSSTIFIQASRDNDCQNQVYRFLQTLLSHIFLYCLITVISNQWFMSKMMLLNPFDFFPVEPKQVTIFGVEARWYKDHISLKRSLLQAGSPYGSTILPITTHSSCLYEEIWRWLTNKIKNGDYSLNKKSSKRKHFLNGLLKKKLLMKWHSVTKFVKLVLLPAHMCFNMVQ